MPHKEGEHTIAFTCGDDMLAMIDRLCATDDRNRSQLLRFLLKEEMRRRGIFTPPRAVPDRP